MKIFFGSFLAVFVMMLLKQVGVSLPLPKLHAQPSPSLSATTWQRVVKLLKPGDSYTIHPSRSGALVSTAYASGDTANARAYVVVDYATGEMLFREQSSEELPIASLTKLMSAVIALDLMKPDDRIRITQRAASMEATRIGVIPGQRMTVEELLEGMLLTSANDAAEALRDGVDTAYNSSVFIRAMNEKAKLLGLSHTHFSNPEGFDSPGNYSSASDLAKLTHYALTTYPLLARIVAHDYLFLSQNADHKQFDLYNWNGLLDVYPDIEGVKIGNTVQAGMTMIVLSNRGGRKILTVLLGAPTITDRDLWASELLDAGYEMTLGLSPINVTKEALLAKYATWRYWQ